MNENETPLFAARLNAFKIGAAEYWPGKNSVSTADLLKRASTAGLTAADLNYPDHFVDDRPSDLALALEDAGMVLNGMAMRYYTEPAFAIGAFIGRDNEWRINSSLAGACVWISLNSRSEGRVCGKPQLKK